MVVLDILDLLIYTSGVLPPQTQHKEVPRKYRRSEVRSTAHALPQLRFEDQALTSFAGLVIFQKFFARMDLKSRLRRCFGPVNPGRAFHPATVFLPLIVPLLLGFRERQDGRYYRDDTLVQRLLGLRRLPTVATLRRVLKQATAPSVDALRRFLRERVLDGLRKLRGQRGSAGRVPRTIEEGSVPDTHPIWGRRSAGSVPACCRAEEPWEEGERARGSEDRTVLPSAVPRFPDGIPMGGTVAEEQSCKTNRAPSKAGAIQQVSILPGQRIADRPE